MEGSHWRLILPRNGEPAYFTWVMDSERGDPALGRVCNTRLVEAASEGGTRKGFVMPGFTGAKGQREPAPVPAR